MPKPKIFDMTDQEIHSHFTQNLEVRDKEKDHFGEVFTPPELINEILDALPANVWSDRDGRWLDPAAGHGNFSAFVYTRLLKSLANKIPNVQERKRHILDKMIFMAEINSSSIKEIRSIFGPNANILAGDFLHLCALQMRMETLPLHSFPPTKSAFEICKGVETMDNKIDNKIDNKTGNIKPGFSVILGNPPFQSDKTETYQGSVGNRTLWDKFLTIGLSGDLLLPNGYLAFITPAGWRRPENPLYDLVTKQNKLHFLHIYGKSDGQDKFGVQTRFDSYIIQKGNATHNLPKIIDEKGKIHTNINPEKWPFLPNYAYDKIRKILVDPKKGIPILFNSSEYDARKLSKRKTVRNRFPVVHGITQKGLGIQFAKERDPKQFGVRKVLLNFNERQYPYNDFAGKYGMSQLTFGIPIKTQAEGDQWIKAILSPEFEEILQATKWGAFQTDYRMFKYFDRNLYKKSTYKNSVNKNSVNKKSASSTRKNQK